MPSVAIVGASANPAKYGNRAVRAYQRQGWTVFPVNPNETVVEGLATFARVTDIPEPVDRVSLYVPPDVGRKVLTDIRAKRVGELFVNPGAESDELVAEAEALGLAPILACSIVDIGEKP